MSQNNFDRKIQTLMNKRFFRHETSVNYERLGVRGLLYTITFCVTVFWAADQLAFSDETIEQSIVAESQKGSGDSFVSRRFARVHPVQPSDVRWTTGFWAQRFETCRDSMVPAMWSVMQGEKYKPYFQHFRIAAGLSEGDYHGAKWNDGDFYKWIEGVCLVQSIEPDPVWLGRLDVIVAVIAKAQREDGYIHTPVLIAARNGDSNAVPFGDRFNFEMYNMGHLMTAACRHHELTGKTTLLDVAKKAADFLDEAFRTPTPEKARHAVCPSHYMGLLDLYRATQEPRYLDLTRRLVAMRDLVEEGGDDNQDRVPFLEQTEAVGHAVRGTYLYAGIADLFAETGEEPQLSVLETVWQNLVSKKMYITGGCGALYDGASPDGSSQQSSITRVHQAFGRNYQLPNSTAHNETCANIGNVIWNWRMFLATGESKYIDVLELALYNAVLSGVSLDGENYFYTNTLRQLDDMPVPLRWSRSRVPYVTSYCCPPNVVRTISGTGGYAYGVGADEIWVNLYGANDFETKLANGRKISVSQQTDYPWQGSVRVLVNDAGDEPLTIHFRIPGWCQRASIKVADESVQEVESGRFVALNRTWKPGDSVLLDFEMPPRLMQSHPLVEETSGQVAVQRGPIVYCLESTDLPKGIRLGDVSIPQDASWEQRFEAQTLSGVTVLETAMNAKESSDWSGTLYREFKPRGRKAFTAKLIPYFAWSNRGASEMSVWLPVDSATKPF